MHQRTSPAVRRVIAGALAVGAVAAAAPAAHAAPSTCSYSATTKTLFISDHSDEKLRLVRVGDQIRYADGKAGANFCAIPGQFATADVTNTDKIEIFRDSPAGGVEIDLSNGVFGPGATPETDGSSEIEIVITTFNQALDGSNSLNVIGTPQNDVLTANPNGSVNVGNDFDPPDVQSNLRPVAVNAHGGLGNDRLRGAGTATQEGITHLIGEQGNDTLMGSPAFESFSGGPGDDRLTTIDGRPEGVNGDSLGANEGTGDFASVDDEDAVTNVETKAVEVHGVGTLKLRKSLHAVAGKTARVAIAWKHPKAWKALRSLEWRLMDGVDQVGAVKIRPRSGKLTAAGAVKLAEGSKVAHKGKTVTARLKLRLPAKLVGAPLTVDVAATDAKGHRQIEAAAAVIDVTA
jgi:hypothetical protein